MGMQISMQLVHYGYANHMQCLAEIEIAAKSYRNDTDNYRTGYRLCIQQFEVHIKYELCK